MLMVIKSLTWLFLWLTIINLPVYMFFYSGSNAKQSDSVSTF